MKKFHCTNLLFIIILGYLGYVFFTSRPAGKVDLSSMYISTVDGNSVAIEELENKVVFLNFWATWCGPCVKEMPSIEKLQASYQGNKNIVFLLASSENSETIKQFAQRKNLEFPLHQLQSSGTNEVDRIPLTYILDKKGKVRKSATGARNWNSKQTRKLIDKLLAS